MNKDKELELLRQWKNNLIKALCKYDCSSVEEIYQRGRKDAIEDFVDMLKNEWTIDSILCANDKYRLIAIFKRIAEQLKEG